VPTYQYACTECGHAFEQFQSFSDDALTECPQCQGRLRKLFNAVGVVFKGSGFYRNDSRATAGSSSTSEGSSSGSGDAANGSSTPAKEKTGSPKESAGSGSSGSGASTSAASGS
jgi:putative FmdB family regulatory protein